VRICTKAVRRSVVRDFEDGYQAGIHKWDRKDDPHFSNKGYTAWVRHMGFLETTWPFNGERASAADKLVLEPMSLLYAERLPVIEEYPQLRKFLTLANSEFKFPVGPDGRNRSGMRPFEARSSRSQPKTSENIPNATKALRSLLAPHEGEVLLHRASSSDVEAAWQERRFRRAVDVFIDQAKMAGVTGVPAMAWPNRRAIVRMMRPDELVVRLRNQAVAAENSSESNEYAVLSGALLPGCVERKERTAVHT
jgi:hypothetical protein